MTFVPDHYRFPLTWFDPRGGGRPGGTTYGAMGQSGIRYSALDVAETELNAKLPPESAVRLEERERRAQAHHRRLWRAEMILDRLL